MITPITIALTSVTMATAAMVLKNAPVGNAVDAGLGCLPPAT